MMGSFSNAGCRSNGPPRCLHNVARHRHHKHSKKTDGIINFSDRNHAHTLLLVWRQGGVLGSSLRFRVLGFGFRV